MTPINRFIRIFALAIAIAAPVSVHAYIDYSTLQRFRYGPNLSWGVLGNTPFVWGEWLPQLVGTVHYTWLEPLEHLNYGAKLGKNPIYLKMEGAVEIAPFYGGYLAGLGLRPLKTNPQFEFNFVYENYVYFNSNLEMVTADVTGEGRIAETWNADFIVDNVWKDESSEVNYAQLFDFCLKLEYDFEGGSVLGVALEYELSDISTEFDGKSYDYKRNMPVFSRDFLFEFLLYGEIPVVQNLGFIYRTSYYRTGYLRNGSTVEKESLGYARFLGGPHLSWKDGYRNLTLLVGAWKRHKPRFYDGSLSQQFLIQLEYQGYFSFPFNRDLSE